MKTTIAREFASRLAAAENCKKLDNQEWLDRHEEAIKMLLDMMPSGSGIDAGTQLDRSKTTPEKLVFTSSYHLMNESGYYVRWIDFTVTVTASLLFKINIKITGNFGRAQDTKDYLTELFDEHLSQEIEVEYNQECGTLVISRSMK